MRSKAINGFLAADVDRVLRNLDGRSMYRIRAELLDLDMVKLYDLAGLQQSNELVYNVENPIQGSGTLDFIQTSRTLASYSSLITTQSRLFHHRLGEAAGATLAADFSGNARPGSYQGTVTFGVASSSLGDPANNAVTFGVGGYGFIGTATWMNVTNITLVTAFKSTGVSETLVDRNNGTTNFWRLDTDSSGKLQFQINFTTGSPTNKTFASGVAINDGNWHYIGASYDGAKVNLYIDGRRVLTTAETRAMKSTGTCDLGIGINAAGTNKSFGSHDEVGMLGRALSAREFRDEFQAWSGKTTELLLDKDRGDRVRVFIGVRMPTAGLDGSGWAEWAVMTLLLSTPRKEYTPTGIPISVSCQDLCKVLGDDTFSTRWTIGAAVNYISGANGILAIAQSAGFDTSGWAVTADTSVTPAAIDFEIGTSKLEAINQLLSFINYRAIRFSGDGSAIIEPNKLDKDRSVADTFASGSQSIIGARSIPVDIAQRSVTNQTTVFNGNPDVAPIQVTTSNTNVRSATSIPNLQLTNGVLFQVDAPDITKLGLIGQQKLNDQTALFAERVVLELLPYPLFEDRNRVTLNIPEVPAVGDYVVYEWRQPLDPKQRTTVTFLSVVDVT